MESSGIAPLADFAAVALGSLFALLLWTTRRGNHNANRWLAAFAAALALLSTGDLMEDTRWIVAHPALAHTTDWLIFAVGPCVWIYVRRLTLNAQPRAWRAVLHFVPAVLVLLLLMPFHLLPEEQKRTLILEELSADLRALDPVIAIAVLHILAYWVAALLTLRRFARKLKEQFSSIEKRSFRWISWVLAVCLLMWLFWLLGLVLRQDWTAWLDLIAVPLGLYVLAFAGLRQPAVFMEMPLVPERTEEVTASRRYARSGLDSALIETLRGRLDEIMLLEKPWLENDLTLPQLAARVGVSPQHLSQVLNDEIGQSFFDYVNSRRVAEVQRCLADPAYASQTLIEVALAAGFNSKAAFNAAFKKHTGLTPSQFRLKAAAGAGLQSTC